MSEHSQAEVSDGNESLPTLLAVGGTVLSDKVNISHHEALHKANAFHLDTQVRLGRDHHPHEEVPWDAFVWPPGSILPPTNQNESGTPCGSCWALSSTDTLSDRWAIHMSGLTGRTVTPQRLSVGALCQKCDCCHGGDTIDAMMRLVRHGSHEHGRGCERRAGEVVWRARKDLHPHHVLDDISFRATPKTIKRMKSEIYRWGPIVCSFMAYDDFMRDTRHWASAGPLPRDRIYIKSPDSTRKGGHSVAIVGWGIERRPVFHKGQFMGRNVHYWVARNSWGSNWGDGGFFRWAMSFQPERANIGIAKMQHGLGFDHNVHGRRFGMPYRTLWGTSACYPDPNSGPRLIAHPPQPAAGLQKKHIVVPHFREHRGRKRLAPHSLEECDPNEHPHTPYPCYQSAAYDAPACAIM